MLNTFFRQIVHCTMLWGKISLVNFEPPFGKKVNHTGHHLTKAMDILAQSTFSFIQKKTNVFNPCEWGINKQTFYPVCGFMCRSCP